jgi:fructose-bisphosphate aldolase class II
MTEKGTVTDHKMFAKVKPKFDFDRIGKIQVLVNVPLVMHGGSGVSPEDYTTAISKKILKINYYSYMSRAGVHGVENLMKERKAESFHDLVVAAIDSMKADTEKAIN